MSGKDVTASSAVRVRVASFEDAEAIGKVQVRNGVGELDPVSWRLTWSAYPFAKEFLDIPIGWVLETEAGEMVGTLANIHTLYEFAGRRIKATVAAAWAVDAAYRGSAMKLTTTWFRQKGIDLWLNVSASPAVSDLLTAMKIPRIPIPDYGAPCFWAVRPRAFARAALLRKGVTGADAWAAPAGIALGVRDVLCRSGRGRIFSTVRRLTEFDDRFDALWRSIAAGPPRLRAIRTNAVLQWRFRADIQEKRAAILVAERDGTACGYAVLVRRKTSELGMEVCDVMDLQSAGDDATTVRDLLLACVNTAREEGVDAVKFLSGTPAKRAPANSLRPYTYRLPFWQQYFKASADLAASLATPEAWDFSPFDSY
jgi:hypothetical protein